MEYFALPKEVSPSFLGFNPDRFGLDDEGLEPLPTQYLAEKVNHRLKRYGFSPDDRKRPQVNSISAEVGDDEIDVSDNVTYAGLLSVFHEELGMIVSEEDTSISKRYGNFTEELIILPDSYYQTYHNARNKSDFRDMSYMDTCKLRLATDIRPMRMGHSSTNDGKASQVGRRQAWIPQGRWRLRYDVFSLYQDIHLSLHRDKKFAYLPESLGGYGKRPPFERKDNIERFIKTFRQGSHAQLVRSIIRHVNTWYGEFSLGRRPETDPLLRFVSRFTAGFHDWVKGHSVYAPTTWVGVPPEVAQYRSSLDSTNPLHRDIISRLLAEDILVPESKVQIVVEHNEFCRELLGKENVLKVRERIESKRKEWIQNSSLFSMENYGYIKEISLLTEGIKPLESIETMVFMKLIDDRSLFNLKVQLRDEPVYRKSVIDDLYQKGPMMVPFQIWPNYLGHTIFAHRDFRREIIDSEEINAVSRLQEWAETGMVGPPPRTVLNDDHSIIMAIDISTCQYHIIITDDKRLCREANRKTRKPIFRVPIEWYVRFTYFGEPGEDPWVKYIEGMTGTSWECHLDEGSMRSFEEIFFKDGMVLSKPARQKFSLRLAERHSTKVEAEYSENFDPESPPDARPDTFLYDYRNMLRISRSKANVT